MLRPLLLCIALLIAATTTIFCQSNPLYDTSQWRNITEFIPSAKLDIRYATKNNFTKKKIYDCAACFMRTEAALALKSIAVELEETEHYLIFYDCYRPSPYQYRLWEIVPNPNYVAPPDKGSVHSRGLAIDLSIIDKDGNELDMGTDHDFFGVEAHQDYYDLPEQVLSNRKRLKDIMEKYGFSPIRTEWWHYNYGNHREVVDHLWDCN